MKKLIVVSMAVLLSASITAENFSSEQSPPPGTVRLEPSKTGVNHAEFIDENVITIRDWLFFLHWAQSINGRQSAEYLEILPDSVILEKSLQHPSWRHPSFSSYAMVGVSYEQAIKYCIWRTNRVNELLEKNGMKYTVSYSLPTETDFEEVYKQQKNTTLKIGADVQELSAGKSVLQIEQTGELNFQPYREPNATVGFRCVAKIIR